MKTLVELVTAEIDRIRDANNGTADAIELPFGIVGTVQGWLGGDAVTALIEGGDLVRCSDLIREAGKGLGEDVAST